MNALPRLRDWWQARDGRERWMLGVMFAALGAFGLWYGVLVPLRWLEADTRQHYARALRQVQATETDLARLAHLRQQPSNPGDSLGGKRLAEAVLSTARDAGIAISRQRGTEAGGLSLGIDATDTGALLAWLDALRDQHGLVPDVLTIERHNGALRVEATFTPPSRPS